MNAEQRQDRLRQLLAKAAHQPPAEGPHFVDDDAILEHWSDGQLSQSDRSQYLDHLDACPYCRDVLAKMLHAGLLSLPEEASDSAAPPPEHSPDVRSPGVGPAPRVHAANRSGGGVGTRTWWSLAAAAGLIGVASLVFMTSRPPNELAIAEMELLEGRPAATLDRLEQWTTASPGDANRRRELAEQAGYQLAGKELAAASFEQARQSLERSQRLGADSARLTNLHLQLERQTPGESSLRLRGTLLDFQLDLDGRSAAKGLPVFDESTGRIEREFQAAIEKYPADAQLKLNFGHFLLGLRRWPDAQRQFHAARDQSPANVEALLGLGLVALDQGLFKEAADWFVQATQAEPGNFAAQLNAAVSLEQEGQTEAAKSHWEQAEKLAPDSNLRALISTRRRDSAKS